MSRGNRNVEDVAEVLVNLNMDVMGLTEVEKPALDRLANEMAGRGSDTDFVSINFSGRIEGAFEFRRAVSSPARFFAVGHEPLADGC